MIGGISLRTALIQGRLAYAMRRVAAARANECGLQILTAPQLAARLAGGLKRPASRESIEAGIMAALARPSNFKELGPVHDKPGMTRALVSTLRNIWRAGFDLRAPPYGDSIRIKDLAYIEDVIRETLEPGEYLFPDLERLARAQLATANKVLGPLILDGVHSIDRLWHGLINDLRLQVDVTWQAPAGADVAWFKGKVLPSNAIEPQQRVFSCANTRRRGRRSRPELEGEMTPTKDDGERARALTDLDATLLVEASAGTGKTSLLAGRVAMLLAEKRPPSSIAAITFTERAAAELRSRVTKFADSLIEDEVPTDLDPAFRKRRLDEAQRRNLREAKDQLGELTACTIHAFCLSILQTYAIEARIDPGASVMDAEQTALAFDSVLDAWLTERLGEDADPSDPIVVMASDDPARAIRTLRDLAEFRRAHPKAKPAGAGLYQEPVRQFVEAVAEYRRWMNRITAPEKALADVEAFEELANLLVPAAEDAPSFGELLVLLHPDSPLLPARKPDFDDSRVLFAYRTRGGAWNKATDATRGPLLAQEDQAHYENCASLFGHALGEMADALLSQYFGETDSLMNRFEEYKLSAAVLDFDDILARTHHLLLTNTKVRQDVAARFRHVLVDEFQDTDPLQCQILMLVCGDDSGALRSGSLFLVGDPKQSIYRFRGADLDTYLRMRDTIAAQFPGNVLHVTANFRSEKRILAHVDRAFADRLRAQLGSYGKLESTIEDAHSFAAVRHSYPTKQTDNTATARQSEAKEIADLCAGLVGNVEIRRSDGSVGFAEPGDIALLSPSRTGLWLYERALEDKGLPVASQAGKNLYRRQETQDIVALDLLILPDPSQPRTDSWFSFFDLGQQALNPVRLPAPKPRPVPAPSANTQTASEFAGEAALVAEASPEIMWFRPSVDDADRELLDNITVAAVQDDADGSPVEPIVGAGGRRGVILHRLMEELIAGLCPAEQSALLERADALLTEAPEDGEARPLAEQLASTALQTFTHPKLAPFRIGLLAEVPLYGARSEAAPISARADAIAVDERGAALACFDWKSDVAPTDATRGQHKGQLAQYLQLIGAPLGAVVYLTTLEFCWIRQDGSDGAGP